MIIYIYFRSWLRFHFTLFTLLAKDAGGFLFQQNITDIMYSVNLKCYLLDQHFHMTISIIFESNYSFFQNQPTQP